MQKFAIIGLGRYGSRLAKNLAAAGHEVIGIDRDQKLVDEIRDHVTHAVTADTTDDKSLKEHGVADVDVAIVSVGNDFEAVMLTTVCLKQLGCKRIVSRAWNPRIAKVLSRIGADEVVDPEHESADRWTSRLLNPQFLAHYDIAPDHSLVEIETPASWVGKTLIELRPRSEFHVNIVAIKHPSGDDEFNPYPLQLPMPAQPLVDGDILVILGSDEDLERLPNDQKAPI